MIFSTPLFLFLFFPFVFTFYFLIPKKFKNFYLVIVSLLFYFKGQKSFVIVMMFSIICNYFFGLLIGRKWSKEYQYAKVTFLILGIQFNLLLLIFYKYS